MFTVKRVDFKHILPLALSFTGFVIFNKSVVGEKNTHAAAGRKEGIDDREQRG